MRSVRLTFGPGYALVMATVFVHACGGATESNSSAAGGTNMGGSEASRGGNSATGSNRGGNSHAGATLIAGGTGNGGVPLTLCSRPPESVEWSDCANAVGGAPSDYPYPLQTTVDPSLCSLQFFIPVAPEGTKPTVSELCATDSEAVSSGWAARVTLTEDPIGGGTATGRIALAPELTPSLVTAIELEIADAEPGLGTLEVGMLTRDGDAFVFPLNFVNPTLETSRFPRLVITVKLTLDCAGQPKSVTSTTALYRCDQSPWGNSAWLSSGDACGECAVICEMAASPIVPPISQTSEVLSQAVRAQVTRLGQYGSTLLLQAQHDGGANRFEYQWDVSAGKILWQKDDLVLWAPPVAAGEHLLQVSLLAFDAAVVASRRIRTSPLEGT